METNGTQQDILHQKQGKLESTWGTTKDEPDTMNREWSATLDMMPEDIRKPAETCKLKASTVKGLHPKNLACVPSRCLNVLARLLNKMAMEARLPERMDSLQVEPTWQTQNAYNVQVRPNCQTNLQGVR